MSPYFVLTNRKRAIVALAHTVVFLGIAMAGFWMVIHPLGAESPLSAWIIAGVYAAVASVLAACSRNGLERLYFAFCTTSAAFGLARQIVGDPRLFVAVYIRVAMLGCAVIAGLAIMRRHEVAQAE
jgi:hypothetical protein